MLNWTDAGAVANPTTVQIRVTRHFPGRVAAGAPEPARSLTADEVVANLRHFTVDRRGPRTRPCTSLVLSGVDLDARGDLAAAVDQGREWGVARVTLHLGHGDRARLAASPLGTRVDAVAVTVSGTPDVADVQALADSPVFVTAVVLLDGTDLVERCAGLLDAGADRVVLTYPFPPAAPPPAATVAGPARRALARLAGAGLDAGIKGLPACALPGVPLDRLWRSGNRWYVDAHHQQADALLFFPDVVRFGKRDPCRFCRADPVCDGAPEPWLASGLVPALTPLD